MLAQDNPELCERISKSLGTYQREERTVQGTRGPLLTEDLGGASARLVEAYWLHPNAIKSLAPVGQGYLLGRPHHGRKPKLESGAHPVCYPRLPANIEADYDLARNDQTKVDGLRLYERFVSPQTSSGRQHNKGERPPAQLTPPAQAR